MGLDVEKWSSQETNEAAAHRSTAGCGRTLPLQQQQQQQHGGERTAPQHYTQRSISGAAASWSPDIRPQHNLLLIHSCIQHTS
ncbi:hypothetical protein ABVT39_023687 [Epinephelus coioides]